MQLKKSFWFHLSIVLVITALIIIIFFSSLGWLTNHGDSKKVPVVIGQQIEGATKMLESAGFKVEIQDSLFVDSLPRRSVLKQSPEGEAIVKSSRTIYLTINRAIAPQVDMPDLKGFSFRSAEMMLQTLNLKLGDTTYKPDIARNAVLQTLFNGNEIAKGTKLNQGSVISLVLGSGVGKEEFSVPEIEGRTFLDVQDILRGRNINLGSVTTGSGCTVSDRDKAYVIKQTPAAYTINSDGSKTKNKMRAGQIMDVVLCETPPDNNADTTATPPATSPE